MKIGIIGPNKLFEGKLEERKSLIEKVAKIIAKSKNEIVLTPDKNSLLEYFGKKYLENGGKKILLIIPTEDKDHEKYLNTKLGEIHSSKDWDRQADEFNRQSDLFICLGYSWGAMKEIACAQYFNKKKVYILKEFVSGKLPKELNFLVEYTSIKGIERYLKP
jgi:predicted Rossmann-fold nucleotide-binding protein